MRTFKFFVIFLLSFSLVFSCSILSFAEESIYVWSSNSNEINSLNNNSNEKINNTNTNDNANNINSNKKINNTNTNDNANNINSNETIQTDSEITDNNSLSLESGSAILIEQTTGKILYSHNIHEKLRPASVTKVMSILLIMEALDNGKISLQDTVPCSENAASMGGSQIWLDPRETLTVDEMLKAICVNSANDYDVQKSQEIFLNLYNI